MHLRPQINVEMKHKSNLVFAQRDGALHASGFQVFAPGARRAVAAREREGMSWINISCFLISFTPIFLFVFSSRSYTSKPSGGAHPPGPGQAYRRWNYAVIYGALSNAWQ